MATMTVAARINLEDERDGLAEVQMPNGKAVDVDLLEALLDFKEIEKNHGVEGGGMSRECLEQIAEYLQEKGVQTKAAAQAYKVYTEICRLATEDQKKSTK